MKIAFHHTNVADVIEEMYEFILSNPSQATTYTYFLEEKYPKEDQKLQFLYGKKVNNRLMSSLFSCLRFGTNLDQSNVSKEFNQSANRLLMYWTMRYADEILDKLVG